MVNLRKNPVSATAKRSPKPVQDLLRLEGITKRFPGVIALNNVDFDLRPGEVHVLLGENGAGKSTLINLICGTYQADEGHKWRTRAPGTRAMKA